jgi:hypothetical protein
MLLMTIAVLAGVPIGVKDVGWIAGCWDFTRDNRHVVEHWMPVEGDTMIGMSRTVVAAKTTEWEFLIIRSGPKGLEYVATPSGQATAVFIATDASSSEVVFENPAHDFPQRIRYRRASPDSLMATVEGDRDGRRQPLRFSYVKAACAHTSDK